VTCSRHLSAKRRLTASPAKFQAAKLKLALELRQLLHARQIRGRWSRTGFCKILSTAESSSRSRGNISCEASRRRWPARQILGLSPISKFQDWGIAPARVVQSLAGTACLATLEGQRSNLDFAGHSLALGPKTLQGTRLELLLTLLLEPCRLRHLLHSAAHHWLVGSACD